MKKAALLLAVVGTFAAGSTLAADRPGEEIFKTVCTMCHTAGVAGAPKFGSAADWGPRIKQGKPALYDHALHGYKGMPAKGTCSTCTDKEIKNAVDYMVSKAK